MHQHYDHPAVTMVRNLVFARRAKVSIEHEEAELRTRMAQLQECKSYCLTQIAESERAVELLRAIYPQEIADYENALMPADKPAAAAA